MQCRVETLTTCAVRNAPSSVAVHDHARSLAVGVGGCVCPGRMVWAFDVVGGCVSGTVYRLRAVRVVDLWFRAVLAGRRLPAGGGDERGESFRGGAAHARQQVLVGVRRTRGGRGRGVRTRPRSRCRRRRATRRGCGQVVEPDPQDAATLDDAVQELADRFGVEKSAGGVAEHPTHRKPGSSVPRWHPYGVRS